MLTNYYLATHWFHNAMILCNNIAQIDPSVYDNCEFSLYDDETDTETEIYQFYLTDCSREDVRYLQQFFPDLLFTYSDLLDMYVLCVDHYGTSWDYVATETTLPQAEAGLGVKK